MSKLKIICSGCYSDHTCTQEKFPLMLLKRIVDPKNARKMINICIGFLCRKCSHKKTILDEIKKNPELKGLGWRKAIDKFLKIGKIRIKKGV